MGMIVFKNFTPDGDTILGTNGEDCIVEALWCLVNNGPEEYINEALSLLKRLGKIA